MKLEIASIIAVILFSTAFASTLNGLLQIVLFAGFVAGGLGLYGSMQNHIAFLLDQILVDKERDFQKRIPKA